MAFIAKNHRLFFDFPWAFRKNRLKLVTIFIYCFKKALSNMVMPRGVSPPFECCVFATLFKLAPADVASVFHINSPKANSVGQPLEIICYALMGIKGDKLGDPSGRPLHCLISPPRFHFALFNFPVAFPYPILFSALSAFSAVTRSLRHFPLDSIRTNVLQCP